MRDPLQIVLLLDLAADNPLPVDEVISKLPGRYDRRLVIRATDYGARAEPKGTPTDWSGCADAVTRMVERARGEISADGQPYRFFIAGRAALPIFVHLGAVLSRWSMNVTLLNQRHDGSWDEIHIDLPPRAERYFEIEGIPGQPAASTGHVAVIVSTHLVVTGDQVRQFAKEHGGTIAGVITAHAHGVVLDASAGSRAAKELVDVMTKVRETYPHASGIELFVAGPATVAFIAGRAINENVIPETWVANYASNAYELALVLPRRAASARALDRGPEHEETRARSLARIRGSLSMLQQTLEAADVKPMLEASEAGRFIANVRALHVGETPEGDEFDLSLNEGTLSLGRGLLDALNAIDDQIADRIAQLVVLHEAYHSRQNLESTTYFGIGRAGFALEEVDYWADTFAAETHIRWRIRVEGVGKVKEVAADTIHAVLAGIEAFDRFEQGPRVERLAERRLRRYLIWHLQRARALTIKSLEDVRELFGGRVVAELAPLVSYLDGRFDKVVRGTLAMTELVVVLGGTLTRTQASAGFDPSRVVEAVRTYDLEALGAMAKYVRDHHKQLLIPWTLR